MVNHRRLNSNNRTYQIQRNKAVCCAWFHKRSPIHQREQARLVDKGMHQSEERECERKRFKDTEMHRKTKT